MSYRATKSGFAAEADIKLQKKFCEDAAHNLLEWIAETIEDSTFNTSGDRTNFHEVLKDGVILCKLGNTLKPKSIKKICQGKMTFHYMANIDSFLKVAKSLGVQDSEMFQTIELVEGTNLYAVLCCLLSIGRKAYDIPGVVGFGPKESKVEKRTWSLDVLNAGKTVIGLQYGSHKGANQSGMNFGNTRHI